MHIFFLRDMLVRKSNTASEGSDNNTLADENAKGTKKSLYGTLNPFKKKKRFFPLFLKNKNEKKSIIL